MYACFDSEMPMTDSTDFGVGKTVEEALTRYYFDVGEVVEVSELTWFKLTPVKVKMVSEVLPLPKPVKNGPQKPSK